MLKKIAVTTSCAAGLLLFFASNISLALTDQHYCVVLWHLPLTTAVMRLPYWTWGAAMLLPMISILATGILWILVVLQTWKRRKVLS
jgi:hypothetical protein